MPSGGDEATSVDASDKPSLAGSSLAELLGTFVLLFFGVGSVSALTSGGG